MSAMGRLVGMIVVAVGTLISQHSHAQTIGNLLRGLTAVEPLIEKLDQKSTDCGLTEEAIRASVLYPISSTKMHVKFAGVILYVKVGSLYVATDQICFSSVRIEAYTIQSVTLIFSGETKRSEVRLWESGFVAYSDRSHHAKQVSESLEDLSKRFVTDWNLDNKTTAGEIRGQPPAPPTDTGGFSPAPPPGFQLVPPGKP